MSRKPRADSVLKTLPDALQETLFQMLRHNTLEKVQAWLAEKHEVKTSTAALSTFWAWYQSSSLKPAAAFADSLAKQMAKMPELALKAEQASQITQTVFELQAAQDRDPKLFFALARQRHDTRRLALEENKFRESIKSDIEKGLDALHEELAGNTEALALFERLKASVMKSVGGAK